MKLKYNVLCIDDDLESLRTIKAQFSKINEEIGIVVDYHDINAKAGAREVERDDYVARMESEINKAFSSSTFELIWIDLHLDIEVEGHELIRFIREHHTIYRPVIFYSAGSPSTQQKAVEQLNDAAGKSGVLGRNILIAPRTAMERTLEEIVREMHREEQKVNQVRGMLMDQVSELDANIIEALSNPKVWSGIKAGNEAKLLKYVREDLLEARMRSATKTYEKVKGVEFEEARALIIGDVKLLDVYSKARLLKEILAVSDGMDRHALVLREYLKEGGLNAIRNNYAHRTAEALAPDHSDANCVAIRNDTRVQLENIRNILEAHA
ncbi:hypothetical protein [Rhizobium leguminosarum]|uniref:hypothetical protein n=1 Tax=Rhizobium leguminosarum TaxID=384 RepID=UPI0014424FA3|nr:hypothetical protein [Rhizobium leguminosarum]MBY5867841.1 hypothetical protein [Rhizobium leguminosarum]NKM06478.1 hypothetical protein [Rhizobium leguminosarum bv. viciae]